MGRGAGESFQKVKDMLSLPLIMISPIKSLPLTLYVIFTNKSISALLAQEVEAIEHFYIILVDHFQVLR